MNLIDRSAASITRAIRNNYAEAASEKVLFYSLSLFINTSIAIISTLILCAFTGRLQEAVITIFSFLFLRYLSGGAHLKSSLGCCLFSLTILTTLAHIDYSYFTIGFILNILSFIIFLMKAPEGLENISRVNPKNYIWLKWICLIYLSSNFFIQSSLLSAIFFVQSVTLTKLGYYLFNLLERRWHYETENGKSS
ncbi:accessory gene regulator B [Paenibacillus sp. PvR052]|nr:accessory gene regulator B [Paenibacillus sp. PvP091]MBP1169912.1 accessory gene regulator B [Paenibacillus sp. PvR098]MBP2440940.1 accessory gene regulator B [Paenibacillus sp. PvP052]